MAIRSAVGQITGDITIIQDADLEYDPQDHIKLIELIRNSEGFAIYRARKRIGPCHSDLRLYGGRKILGK